MVSRNATTTNAAPPSVCTMWSRMASLIASTNKVKPGILTPMPAKTSLNLGTTMTINKIMMPTATTSTVTG